MHGRSIIARLLAFVREFLPENPSQLLFPLATFLLLLGAWHPWLPPNHTLVDPTLQAGETDLWFDASSRLALFGYGTSLLSVRFAFLASIVLWALPFEKPIRRFARWVIVPVGVGVTIFSTMASLAKSPQASILEPSSRVIYGVIHQFSQRLTSLGTGFYLTLLGTAVLLAALRGVSAGRISLPVRFHDRMAGQQSELGVSQGGRDVLVFLIAINVLAFIPSLILSSVWANNPRRWSWGAGQFPSVDWWLNTIYAAIAAICACAILLKTGKLELRRLFLSFPARDVARAALAAVLVVFLPRILMGMAEQFDWRSIGVEPVFPFSWTELLVPKPFPWLLLVFITALFGEVALRGFLQARLTEAVGLRRAIFLVGVLWGILPLSYGIHPILGLGIRVPGAEMLIAWAILIAYSVPLGWAFARTRSLIPATVMHGAFLLLHKGSSETVYLNQQMAYWIELVLLGLAGWYLFKRYPVQRRDESPRLIQIETG